MSGSQFATGADGIPIVPLDVPAPAPTKPASPPATAQTTTPPPTRDPNALYLLINNQVVTGWEFVSFSRSIEQFPSSFVIVATEKDPTGKTNLFVPFQRCQVYLGNDLVLTGYVDRVTNTLDATAHSITLSGRSKCADLVDCSAEFPATAYTQTVGSDVPAMYQANVNLLGLAQQLCKPYGITVSLHTAQSLQNIPLYSVNLGDTPYQILELLARSQNLLLYDDAAGNLVLADVGYAAHSSGFEYGSNIQSITTEMDFSQRYSEIDIFYQSVTTLPQDGSPVPHGVAKDSPYIRHRRLMAYSEAQGVNPDEWIQRRANWEMNRRQGRSQTLLIKTDSWRDIDFLLWQPNYLVTVQSPTLRIPQASWVIVDVVYERDLQGGTTATLKIMPPNAFTIEPTIASPVDPGIGPTMNPYDGPELTDENIPT